MESLKFKRATINFLPTLIFMMISWNLAAQSRNAELTNYFTNLRNNQQFNGNVLVAENGKIVYQQSFGYAEFSSKSPNKPDTRFPIASISKTLTATAILQLAEAEKLDVADAVVKYLPTFPYSDITIQQLMSHSSGLPPYNAFFDSLRKQDKKRVFTNADFLDGLIRNKKPLIYKPGEKENYDNINYIVLALIIEKISGLSYQEYIEKKILSPAGMTQTKFSSFDVQYAGEINYPFAYPYLFPYRYVDSVVKAKEVPYIVEYWSAYKFSGFGDYISTVGDLLKYDQAYYNGKLLHSKILETAYTPIRLQNKTNSRGDFGLGWQVGKDSSLGKIVFHGGGATGLSCVLMRNLTRKQTVILFDNTHSNANSIAVEAMKVLNGVPVKFPGKSIVKEYAKLLSDSGAIVARATVLRLMKDSLHYQLNEDEMNSLGYNYMGSSNNPNVFNFPEPRKYKEAYETLKLNMELFPNSWNVYDSFGEILLKMGQKEEAIRMYKKSLELNPQNENGRKMLEAANK